MAHIYNDREREAQRRMMEGKMQRIQMELDRARVAAATGRAQEVERVIRNVRSQLNDVTLPLDFQKQIQDQSKKLELDAYVKAVDMTLEQAREHALARRETDKIKAIKLARELHVKAIQFGAGQQFKDTVNKKIDIIMLSGGHKIDGPTAAKPMENMPKVRDLAKGEKRNYKRYEHPSLTVVIADSEYHTIDWSIGGLLIGGIVAEVPVGMDIPLSYGLKTSSQRFNATVKVVRSNPDKGTLAVRFVKSTMDALEFLRGLIKQQPGSR